MVNYGNSKALVQVNERRPHNPDGPVKSAWGQTGTMLEGQPLAIEYNANVLEDRPAMPEMISEAPSSLRDRAMHPACALGAVALPWFMCRTVECPC